MPKSARLLRIRQTSGIDDALDATDRKQNHNKQTQDPKPISKPGELIEIGKLAANVLGDNSNNDQPVSSSSSKRHRSRSHGKRNKPEPKTATNKAGKSNASTKTSGDEYVIHLR